MPNGIPSWAVRGAKVVCVDDVPRWNAAKGRPSRYSAMPVKGVVYTIAEPPLLWPGRRDVGVRLQEISRVGRNAPFGLWRFRPAVPHRSQEQDVSRFRKHLRTKRTRTDAFVKIPHHGTIGE